MRTGAGDFKKGDFILHQGEAWQVQKTEFSFQGRGMAVVRIKIKSISSQKNIDLTVKSVESLELVDVSTVEMQYLYKDNVSLHFMNHKTYEQTTIPTELVGDLANFLKPGEKYYVLIHEDRALNIRPPLNVRLKVVHTEAAVKGDTVSGAKKPATLETEVTVMVPLFIKEGDIIVVNPETGEYVERTKS